MQSFIYIFRYILTIFIPILSIINPFHCAHVVNIDEHTQVNGDIVKFHDMPIAQFLGVPYAEPPVGKLRFKKPIPVRKPSSVLLAFNPPPACIQEKSPAEYPWYDEYNGKSEDCLYLNIWAPLDATPKNPKAVIYWIHGGGFRLGSNRQMVYYGAPLAAYGDVIVVTVNYRLGRFGFFTTGTQEAPGNVGLWDILEGLRWVNKHISAFGGDPSAVTIAGQGAGAVSVGLLSVSPLAKGLYQRQIMESGSPAYPDGGLPKRNLDLSQGIAERLKCATNNYKITENAAKVVRCLQNVDAEHLNSVHMVETPTSGFTFLPGFGDKILPNDPTDLVGNMSLNCNQLLIGVTKDEGSTQIIKGFPSVFGDFGSKNPNVSKSQGKDLIQEIFRYFQDPEAVVEHYLPDSIPEESFEKVRQQVADSSGDAMEVCPTVYYAEKCAEGGGDVFFYLWQHRANNSEFAPWAGVTHFSEVEFIFGKPLRANQTFSSDEAGLSQEMIEIWSTFAKTGKPNIPWPQYSKENPQLEYLGPKPGPKKIGNGFHVDNCNFFRPFYGF